MLARFRPYYHYLRPVRVRFISGIGLGVLAGGASSAGISWMIKKVFQPFFEAAGGTRLETRELLALLALIPLVFGVRCVAQFLNSYLVAYCGTVVLEGLRKDLFGKFQRLPLGYFQKAKSGELLARAVSDAQQAPLTLTSSASDIVVLPATFLGGIGYIVYIAINEPGTGMFLLGLAAIPVAVLPIKIIGKNLYRRAKQAFEANGEISEILRENLSAAREVRAFALEEREQSRFAASVRRFFEQQMKVNKYAFSLSPLIEFLTGIGIAIALFMAYRAGSPWSSVISMLPALYFCADAMRRMGKMQTELTRGVAALDRLEQVLHEPEPIADPAEPKTLGRARGEIEFRDVAFTYGGGSAEETVLREVSAKIPAGAVVALVGPSGAGKSTFANLVPRFYDATQGEVLVDGVNVRDYKLKALRDKIGYVPQQSFLFKGTIASNVAYGDTDRDDDTVRRACDVAQATEFIDKKQKKYDSGISQGGSNVSGGQKQRLSIARAVYRHPEILIFDDSFSALDFKTDRAVRDALEKEAKDSTKLIVAQRIGTIMNADRIIVLDDGKVVGQGTHEELLDTCEVYRQIAESQLSEDELKR